MWKQTDLSIVELSESFITWFASLPTCKGNRNPDKISGRRRIASLSRKLTLGQFFSPAWAIVMVDGKQYRINGNHSSQMLLLNKNVDIAPTQAVMWKFTADSIDDVPDLLDQFDPRLSVRSKMEKLNVHQAVTAELDDISVTLVSLACVGICASLCHYESSRKAGVGEDEQIRLMHEHADFIVWAAPYLRHQHLCRREIAGCMFDTFKQAQSIGLTTLFWRRVSCEDHPDSNNATRTLANVLRSSHIKKERCLPLVQKSQCYRAWNAWLKGKTTTLRTRSADNNYSQTLLSSPTIRYELL